MKIIASILITLLISFFACSQDLRQNYFEVKYHYGTLIKHSPKIDPLVKGKIETLELNYTIPAIGKHKWSQIYRYPEFGVGYQLALWKNPDTLGTSHVLNTYIRIPLIKTKPFKFYYHIGTGPCIFTQKYDSITNKLNKAIGSYFNLYIHAGLEASFQLHKNFRINAGYGINHYSIGNLDQPNVGLNVIASYVSASYSFDNEKTIYHKQEIEKKERGHEIWGYIGPGFKEIDITLEPGVLQYDNKKYFTTTVSVNYAYQINYKRKFGFGFEYFYDNSIEVRIIKEDKNKFEKGDNIRPGFNISHELLFRDLSFITQFGWYIYSKLERFGNNYYRVGFKYHFKNNVFVLLALKVHPPAIADFTEWGLGYRFR